MTQAKTERTRADLLAQVGQTERWDVVVIGGGATGLGIALQAAVQGLKVLLLEADDFASGTSSRSTKLLHGGVRYLAQGHLGLVRDALNERQTVIHNAPSLAHPLEFVLPTYRWQESWKYRIGLRIYDWLSGDSSLGKTGWTNAAQAVHQVPALNSNRLHGLVTYWDGQFDDAGLAVALARTAHRHGAVLLNYCPVDSIEIEQGRVQGVRWKNAFDGTTQLARSSCVINAAGPWLDALRAPSSPRAVTLSRGTHLVVDRTFWPHEQGLIIPQTSDGRVLFVLPWQGHVVLGTTDVPCDVATTHPRPEPEEIEFILSEVARYLTRAPQRDDITSQWSGVRSLVLPASGTSTATRSIGREHAIWQDPDGLVCVAGGKWTTYRLMGEQVVTFCRQAGLMDTDMPLVSTRHVTLDCPQPSQWESGYGSTVAWGSDISEGFIRWNVRHTQACTVEDMLTRRSRLLMVDARHAQDLAPAVAEIMQDEGLSTVGLERFLAVASQHLPQAS